MAQQITELDRYRGCLLGGAVGDALGYCVEFDAWPMIRAKYGEEGIRDYAKHDYAPLGGVSDDTQMTLFTAEGLLRAYVRLRSKGITTVGGVTENAYLRWYHTMGNAIDDQIKDGWLLTHRDLFASRAPGTTCLHALRNLLAFKQGRLTEIPSNDSKGCGTVMRLAPVALVGHTEGWTLQQTAETAIELAEITHHHRTSSVASAALVVLLRHVLAGMDKEEAVKAMLDYARKQKGAEEFLHAFAALDAALADPEPTHKVIERYLGGGWIAEEALLIAVYAVLKSDDFDEIMRIAVNHSGDSDSTGAIAGNIAGALYGINAIDEARWLKHLELRDVIEEMATDLHGYHSWPSDEYGDIVEHVWDKYPGH